MALKCADLGHLASAQHVHLRWVHLLEEEMFRQGDLEKARGYPVSPLMDRDKEGITKSQPGVSRVYYVLSHWKGGGKMGGLLLTASGRFCLQQHISICPPPFLPAFPPVLCSSSTSSYCHCSRASLLRCRPSSRCWTRYDPVVSPCTAMYRHVPPCTAMHRHVQSPFPPALPAVEPC